MTRVTVLGTEIDSTTQTEAVDRAMTAMHERKGAFVITPNAEYLLQAKTQRDLRQISQSAFLSLPDSIGVLAAARILKIPLHQRVTGIDFAFSLLKKMGERGRSVFLLGARQGIAEAAADRLRELIPGLVIAGTSHGYFSSTDEKRICERINTASPDLLIVCLGSPRQERWMYKNSSALHVGLMAGLGGTLDVFAGNVDRAPEGWRKIGLEWLYRSIREPKRITRILRIPLIIPVSLRYRVRGK